MLCRIRCTSQRGIRAVLLASRSRKCPARQPAWACSERPTPPAAPTLPCHHARRLRSALRNGRCGMPLTLQCCEARAPQVVWWLSCTQGEEKGSEGARLMQEGQRAQHQRHSTRLLLPLLLLLLHPAVVNAMPCWSLAPYPQAVRRCCAAGPCKLL